MYKNTPLSLFILTCLIFFYLPPHNADASGTEEIQIQKPLPGKSAKTRTSRLEEISLTLETGYRVDQLDWNHASDRTGNTTPNIRSELTWEDIESYQLRAAGRITHKMGRLPFSATYRGYISSGLIVDGMNQDSDYNGNDRAQEFSRSNNSSDDGSVFDTQFGLGFTFRPSPKRFHISPLFGWSYHEQNLTMTDGDQTIPATGSFSGLDSSYNSQWYGLWTGAEIEFMPINKLALTGSLELHSVKYYAEANWNLRNDLKHPNSFEHNADEGSGIVLNLGGKYIFGKKWSLNLALNYSKWQMENGTHTFHMSSGANVTYRLNEVNWESFSSMVGVKYRFK
ncbi:MAG: hypothetical protein KKE17_04500 [Proteobacteria bacterium]|nr:hypothetical protein [Pseudomonadota bacterium]MBU1709247.1 hypothetical protein [Pseudomonadota bacterium]